MISEDQIRQAVVERTEHLRRAAADHPFARRQLPRIVELLDDSSHSRAVVLLGPRQVGKSTLLAQALRHMESAGARVWACDFTDRLLAGAGLRNVVRALGLTRESGPSFVFLDEVHYVDGWERELKLLVDERAARFAVADSAAAVLRAAMRDAGAGRWTMVQVRPLSFPEWLQLRDDHGLTAVRTPIGMSTACAEFLRRGGLPEFARGRTPIGEVHRVIRDDLVERAIRADVGPIHGIRNLHGLEQLLHWVVAGSGQQVTFSKATEAVGTKGETTRSWLSALQDTGLVWLLPTWNKSAAKRARRPAKGYASDPGLVAAFTPGGAGDGDRHLLGRLVETACACAAREHVEPASGSLGYFERRKRDRIVGEADLVFELEDRRVLLEATASRQPAKKLRRIADRARDLGGVDMAFIVTPAVLERSVRTIGEQRIHIVPLHEMLQALSQGTVPAW